MRGVGYPSNVPSSRRRMNQSLSDLYRANAISYEEALAHSSEPSELERLLRSV